METNKEIVVTNRLNKSKFATDCILFDFHKLTNDFQSLAEKNNLQTEAQKKITIEFVLQTFKNPRQLIKFLDCLLKVNGEFLIVLAYSQSHSMFFRSVEQIKYEFSMSTNGRYILKHSENEHGILKLSYIKTSTTLLENDSINKWSFGIVSGGSNNPWVKELIDSIQSQNIPEYEILICGPSPFNDNGGQPDKVVVLDDYFLDQDIRAPITFKKNKILRKAKYNNVCLLHDRYLLPTSWFEDFKKFGNYFDAVCLKNLSKEGDRFSVDWMKYYSPLSSRFKLNRTLLYDEWHPEAIIPGGVMVLKKNLFQTFLFDERLFWDELEDMQLSKIAYLNGILISVDANNYFISRQVRHKTQKLNWASIKVFSKLNWLKALIKNYFEYQKKLRAYFKN